MNNTIRWSLFGEIINDEIDLDHLPKYITGDLLRDIELYKEEKNENMKEDGFSVSDLVQDVFYVVTLSEIDSLDNLNDNPNDEQLFQRIRENEETETLLKVDSINRLLMDIFTVMHYEIQYKINEIKDGIDSIQDKEEMHRYFSSVTQILYENESDIPIESLRNVHVEDISLQQLIIDINEAIMQMQDNAFSNSILRVVRRWIMLPDFSITTKFELKRRLLRDIIEEYNEGVIYLYRYTLENVNRLPLLFNALVQDEEYMGIINEQLSLLNQEVIYVQNIICNSTFIKSKSFIKDPILKMLESRLRKYGDLKPYITGKKCFAYMKSYNCSNSFFSISGLDNKNNPQGIQKACKKIENILMQKKCYRVKLSYRPIKNKVAYHISNSKNVYLIYDDYCRYETYLNGSGKPKSCGRMFSCCERKLFARLTNLDKFVIYVSSTSCYMCKDAAMYIRKSSHYNFKVIYGKHYNPVSNSTRQNYDNRAWADINAINYLKNKNEL